MSDLSDSMKLTSSSSKLNPLCAESKPANRRREA